MSGAENLQCVPGRQFLVRWRIKNASMFGIKEDQHETSAIFEVPFLGNTQWYLKLLFKLPEERNIMCFLWRNDKGPEYVNVHYSISVGSSYIAELQTFARNSSCFNPGLINRGKFNEEIFRGQSKDVLHVECRLCPEADSKVPTLISPYPVGIEMVTIIPKETQSMFYKIPNFSNFQEGQATEFCVNSAGCCRSVPKLNCRLRNEQQILLVLVRESSNLSIPFLLNCKVHLLDAFGDRHFLYHGSTVINYGGEPFRGTMNFFLAKSKKQLMEKKDLYLPGNELLLHWEFAHSDNSSIATFIKRTVYPDPTDLQANR